MKAWKAILYLLSVPPLVFSIALLTFFFHAWIILGEPPGYNQPDPKELYIYPEYHTILAPSLFLAFFGFFACVIAVALYIIVNRKKTEWRPVIVCGVAYLGWICIVCSELL